MVDDPDRLPRCGWSLLHWSAFLEPSDRNLPWRTAPWRSRSVAQWTCRWRATY